MPRFSDEWVVDRVLFDYVSGGSCACCGISHSMFLPNGINDYITSMTDLETDQMNTEMEILASDLHPWPKVLRDQIWCDRVKLKQKLKSTISKYTTFWCQHGTPFTEWLLMIPSMSSSSSSSSSPIPSTPTSSVDHTNNNRKHLENHTNHEKVQRLQRCIQMSRDEFISYIQQEFNIHSAYMVVLTAVMEQVAHFPETKYPLDSLRSSSSHHTNENDNNKDHQAELHFEEILHFGRMSGFTLPITVKATAAMTMMKGMNDPADPKKEMNFRSEVVQILLDRIRTLGNTKLLGRGPSTATNRSRNTKNQLRTLNRKNADDDDDDDDDELEDVDEEDDDDVDGPTSRQEIAAAVHPSSTTFTKCGIPTPSFQSDRRMIRLILARYWADVLIQRYYTDTQTAVRHDKDNDPS